MNDIDMFINETKNPDRFQFNTAVFKSMMKFFYGPRLKKIKILSTVQNFTCNKN